jgi:hypothetical protein
MAIEKKPRPREQTAEACQGKEKPWYALLATENGLTSSRWRDLLTRRSHSTTVAGTTSRHSNSTSAWMEADPNA